MAVAEAVQHTHLELALEMVALVAVAAVQQIMVLLGLAAALQETLVEVVDAQTRLVERVEVTLEVAVVAEPIAQDLVEKAAQEL
jgi:predicted phage gp36 major capsid-like protein